MLGFTAIGEIVSRDVPEFSATGKSHDPLEVPNHRGKLPVPHLGERGSDARIPSAENSVAPALATRQFWVLTHNVDHRFEQAKPNRLAVVKQKNDLTRAGAHFIGKLGKT